MKMYLKLLRRSTLLCASVLMFCSIDAAASTNSVVIPISDNETALSELSTPPPSNLQIVSITPYEYNGAVHIRCWGQSNGSATAEVLGGLAPYTYQWSGLPNQTGPTAVGMSAGTYTLTVTDALGFSVSESVTLIQNPPLQGIATVSPILCNGGVATVTLSATGGTMPYSGLVWYQVVSGTHSFTVADANGCRNKVTTDITEPPAFEATSVATPILCNGDLSTVEVEGFGGIAPYNGTGLYPEAAGVSSYIITDANGCFAYTSVVIDEPSVLEVDISHTEIACRGGSSDVTVTGLGGTLPYSGTGNFTQTSGTYQYTVVDGNGCQSTASVVITSPLALTAMISSTPIACQGGVSTVEVTAGGGTLPYVGPGIFIEQAGLHSYNVTDANGCSVDISTIVVEPRALQLDISWDLIEVEGGTTDVEVIAIGGTPSYSGTGTFTVSEGTHYFTVDDANGCSTTQAITVAPYDPSALNLAGMNESQNTEVKTNTIDDRNTSFVRAAFNLHSEEMEIAYRLEYDSKVRIEIYNMTGALVEVIQQDMAVEGENYTVSIEPGKLTTGVYVYQFITDSERQIDKLQIIR